MDFVPIHDNVDCQIQCNWHPTDRGVTNELRVAKQCSRPMMVGVKERFLDQYPGKLLGRKDLLRGFFFNTRNTVSMSSRYLVK